MKTIVIYDTTYGNTEKIARAIAGGAGKETKAIRVNQVRIEDLNSYNFVIIGSPTQGGRPTKPMQDFLSGLTDGSLQGIKAAAFDTRLVTKWVTIFGYAAGKIADALQKKGADVFTSEAFYVTGKQPVLKEGEMERSLVWAKEVVKKAEIVRAD
jgi:flavodoxin I